MVNMRIHRTNIYIRLPCRKYVNNLEKNHPFQQSINKRYVKRPFPPPPAQPISNALPASANRQLRTSRQSQSTAQPERAVSPSQPPTSNALPASANRQPRTRRQSQPTANLERAASSSKQAPNLEQNKKAHSQRTQKVQ